MCKQNEDILHQNLEIPEMVWKKANAAFTQIHKEAAEKQKLPARKKAGLFRLPKAAAAAIICCLICGTTAAAAGIISLYRQRMENMEKQEMENFYQLANAGEANSLNRPFTAEEAKRYRVLTEEYERNGLFPNGALTVLSDAASYNGQGVAIDASTRTIYLPEGTLSDEELLQIIDFNHKMTYSIY